MALSPDSRLTMSHGGAIPVLGLGTWQSRGAEARRAVTTALKQGYRLIDTAQMYRNEEEVGQGIAESGIPREEIFVTTKLDNNNHGREQVTRSFDESLRKLGTGYVDLFLIHWPIEGAWPESWLAMEPLLKGGRCRAIGVSNFSVKDLAELARISKIVPAVNQIEVHPFDYPVKLIDHCRERGVVVEAYSPLVRGKQMAHPDLVRIGASHGKSVAQVLLRWGLQHGLVEIPKTTKAERLRENRDIFDFELDEAEMMKLDRVQDRLHESALDPAPSR